MTRRSGWGTEVCGGVRQGKEMGGEEGGETGVGI